MMVCPVILTDATPPLWPWIDMPTMSVSSVKRLITVGRRVVMRKLLKNSIQRSWFVAVVRMWHEHKCVRSTGRTSSSTNVASVVRWRFSSASVRHTFATPAMMTFSV